MDKPSEHSIYEFDDFRLDAGPLMLSRNSEEIPLTPKSVETLLALVERRGEIVSKEELLNAVWPDTAVEESNLFLYLSVLRKVLGKQKDGTPYIETLRRRGYRFNGFVRQPPVQNRSAPSANALERSEPDVKTRSGRVDNGSNNSNGESHLFENTEPASVEAFRAPIAEAMPVFPGESNRSAAAAGRGRFRAWKVWLSAAAIAMMPLAGVLYLLYSPAQTKTTAADISVTELAAADDVHGPIISPDGKLLVYNVVDGEQVRVMLQVIGQLNAIEIFKRSSLGDRTFSPDGAHLYFSAQDKGEPELSLYKMSTLGGSARKVVANVSESSPVSFSPDGHEFTFVRFNRDTGESAIFVAGADGGNEREIVSTNNGRIFYPAWSPDGKRIAFARSFVTPNRRDHYVAIEMVDLNGEAAPQRLLPEKLVNCFRIAWTADGRGLVFGGTRLGEAMTARRDQVWFFDLADQQLRRLTPEGIRYTFGGLTNDNAAIVGTVDRASQVWVMDANGDSRTAVQLTRGSTDGRTGLTPLPDGRIGYATRNGDNWEIWTMNQDGTGSTLAFDGNSTLEELRASPDGRYFFFNADARGTNQLFRLGTDGVGLTQLTFDDSVYIGDSSPTADGTSVVFDRKVFNDDKTESMALYRVPVKGGEPVPVEGATPGLIHPHYSRDGKHISLIDVSRAPIRLAVLATDGQSDPRFFEASPNAVLNVGAVWTPDGESLAYIVFGRKASNIWLRPVNGGAPHQLTNFTSGHIYRIAYSSDGRKIYLARGHPTNKALLIKGFADPGDRILPD